MAMMRLPATSEPVLDRHRTISLVALALAACAAGLAVPLPDISQSQTMSRPPPPLIAMSSAVPAPPQPSPSVPLVWTNASVERAWSLPTEMSLSEQPASFEITHDMIARAQRDLLRLGYDPGTPDGVIGPKTRKAIRLFQQARGLEPNGMPSAELTDILRATR